MVHLSGADRQLVEYYMPLAISRADDRQLFADYLPVAISRVGEGSSHIAHALLAYLVECVEFQAEERA